MKRSIVALYFISTLIGFSQQSKKAFLRDIINNFQTLGILPFPQMEMRFYFQLKVLANISVIIRIDKQKGKWGKPRVAQFSGQYYDLEPFFSPDGLKIYFASNRPIDKASNTIKDFDIWYVHRDAFNKDWSEPKNLGSPINTQYDEFYPSITTNGNLYFTRDNTSLNNKDDIYLSELKDNVYAEPIVLSNVINSEGYDIMRLLPLMNLF